MRTKIKAGDLEVGAIAFIGDKTYRIIDFQHHVSLGWGEFLAVQLTVLGEIKVDFTLALEQKIEGHNRIDRLQLGRRYRLRDRCNHQETIDDCIAVYGGPELNGDFRSYSIRNVETGLVLAEDTNGIAVGEPEVLEDLSPAPGQQVRVNSQSIEGAIVRQLPDGRWLVDCGEGVGEFEAEIWDLEYSNA